MTNQSAEEVLDHYLKEFGPKDGPIIAHLTNKVANLARQWSILLYFFCGPKERVDVLNEASGSTAMMLRSLLWDNTLIRIRQLTDPAKSRNNDNLSLEHLVRIAEELGKESLSAMHDETKMACQASRVYVTKNLAHLDLGHAVGDVKSEVTRGQTTEAVRAICRFVQEFHARVRNVHFVLMPITSRDDEQKFLLRVHLGNKAAEKSEAVVCQALTEGDLRKAEREEAPGWVWEGREARNFLDPI